MVPARGTSLVAGSGQCLEGKAFCVLDIFREGGPQRRPSPVLVLAWLGPAFAGTPTAFCKCWHSWEVLEPSILWSFTVLPDFHLNVCLGRVGFPRHVQLVLADIVQI